MIIFWQASVCPYVFPHACPFVNLTWQKASLCKGNYGLLNEGPGLLSRVYNLELLIDVTIGGLSSSLTGIRMIWKIWYDMLTSFIRLYSLWLRQELIIQQSVTNNIWNNGLSYTSFKKNYIFRIQNNHIKRSIFLLNIVVLQDSGKI